MASQTQGIQQLLVAEKRAAEKVSEARKRKNRRLKQAKEEAQVNIINILKQLLDLLLINNYNSSIFSLSKFAKYFPILTIMLKAGLCGSLKTLHCLIFTYL